MKQQENIREHMSPERLTMLLVVTAVLAAVAIMVIPYRQAYNPEAVCEAQAKPIPEHCSVLDQATTATMSADCLTARETRKLEHRACLAQIDFAFSAGL